MPHRVKTVVPLPAYELQIRFRCGITKKYDMKPMMENIQVLGHFLRDQGLFEKARISPEGDAVVWNEYADIGCEELWRGGKAVKGPFDNLFSCSDAAALWGLDESTLRKAIADGRLRDGVDVMKFGKQWVVTSKAMEKLFGKLEDLAFTRLSGKKHI